jgi:inositol-phosphate phosphatase/L-galactose 1-phosphate phosphatase/histidinol-phosphatase
VPAPTLPELLAFAEGLADVARPIARRHFRALHGVDLKADRSPVTLADRAIERALRGRIAAVHPGHGVLGEEEAPDRADAEFLWVLDPIDGTKAFATGNPLFGTLIGLMQRGVPVLGVLDAAALGERWTAASGLGCRHQGAPIRTRPVQRLADAVMYSTTPEAAGHAGLQALRQRVRWTSLGGDCCAYGFVAMGGADLVVDRGLKPYDWCALVPIVTESGGVLADWNGRELRLDSDGAVIAAATRELAAETIVCLRG